MKTLLLPFVLFAAACSCAPEPIVQPGTHACADLPSSCSRVDSVAYHTLPQVEPVNVYACGRALYVEVEYSGDLCLVSDGRFFYTYPPRQHLRLVKMGTEPTGPWEVMRFPLDSVTTCSDTVEFILSGHAYRVAI